MIAGLSAQHIIADKACDTDKFRAARTGDDITAVIPPKAIRPPQRPQVAAFVQIPDGVSEQTIEVAGRRSIERLSGR